MPTHRKSAAEMILEDRALDPAPVEREDAQGDEAHVANTLFVGFAVAVAPLALASKPEALKVFFRPPRLLFNHAPKCFRNESCASAMVRERHSTPVRMLIAFVTAPLCL